MEKLTVGLSPIMFQDIDAGYIGLRSPSDAQLNFLPIFRSGSCSEMGPKQYMEDEHICIDNLMDHLGEKARFPSPGAFYGVSIFNFQ